jgi:serine palmitoyltransferase
MIFGVSIAFDLSTARPSFVVLCVRSSDNPQVIMGEDGTTTGRKKLDSLRDNSNYMRRELTRMGLHVYGNYDSPVIPVMLYNPTKIAAFSRECYKRGVAVVVVGFPATTIVLSRTRICVSAGEGWLSV